MISVTLICISLIFLFELCSSQGQDWNNRWNHSPGHWRNFGPRFHHRGPPPPPPPHHLFHPPLFPGMPPPIPPRGFGGNPGFFGRGPANIIKITEFVDAGSPNFDILSSFKDHHRHNKKFSRRDWHQNVKRFCHRFPGHPSCRRGRVPDQNEIQDMIEKLSHGGIGKFLKRVPRIHIEDPLTRVDPRLKNIISDFNRDFGHINQDYVNKIKDVCKRRKCRQQPESAKTKKELITKKILEFETKVSGKDRSDAVLLRFDRTFQIKEALLERGNLAADVTPVDDGIYDLDTILTEEQANILLNELNKSGEGQDEIPLPDFDETASNATKIPTATNSTSSKSRPRKSALYFEGNLIKKWDSHSPIRYVLDSSLEEADKNDVRSATYEIEKNTCIRFKELASPPTESHIVYYKVDSPTFCGLSYVGRADPANPIYLSFACGNSKGVAIHETLHALGVAHQHLRNDRDQFITINWSNIDPQQYDAFVIVDSKLYTSYGVKYAYDSIMHYNGYTAAQNIAIPTMKPKNNPETNLNILGQREKLSTADIELLKKMYCMPGCEDTNVYCGAWALKNLCNNPNHNQFMTTNCKKSCNLCAKG